MRYGIIYQAVYSGGDTSESRVRFYEGKTRAEALAKWADHYIEDTISTSYRPIAWFSDDDNDYVIRDIVPPLATGYVAADGAWRI